MCCHATGLEACSEWPTHIPGFMICMLISMKLNQILKLCKLHYILACFSSRECILPDYHGFPFTIRLEFILIISCHNFMVSANKSSGHMCSESFVSIILILSFHNIHGIPR